MHRILFTDRERDIMQLILELLAAGVILSTALVAPGAVGILAKSYLRLQKVPRKEQRRALAEMKRHGLVGVRGGSWLAMTKKGRARLQKYTLEELAIQRPRIWDGHWRIVLFDIPRKPQQLNRARDHFRGMLKRLGLVPVQKSVWAHPFPCDEEVSYVTELYGLQPFVRVALARKITGQEKLKQAFNL